MDQTTNDGGARQTTALKIKSIDNTHISPLAGIIAGVVFALGIGGAALMDGEVMDLWIGLDCTSLP